MIAATAPPAMALAAFSPKVIVPRLQCTTLPAQDPDESQSPPSTSGPDSLPVAPPSIEAAVKSFVPTVTDASAIHGTMLHTATPGAEISTSLLTWLKEAFALAESIAATDMTRSEERRVGK